MSGKSSLVTAPDLMLTRSTSVMYHIVEDTMPPIPDDCSDPLKDFLRQCFQRDPSERPSAEVLCEHDWLKKFWGAHKELRPQDSIPFLRRVSADLQKTAEGVRFFGATDTPRSDSQASDRPRRSEDRSASPAMHGLPGSPPRMSTPLKLESEISSPREHSFVKTAFGKRECSAFSHFTIFLMTVLCSRALPRMYGTCQEERSSLCRMQLDCTFSMCC